MYRVKQEDLIGDIKDFPIEVVQKMVERQVEQGNEADVTVFQNSKERDMTGGGFNWINSIEGNIFWRGVIRMRNFDMFFEKYPKSETQGLIESFVNDFKEYLNTIEKQIMYARTLLNDIKPEPLFPDVDFSILNNEDWFYMKTNTGNDRGMIFKLDKINGNEVWMRNRFYIADNKYDDESLWQHKKRIATLRKATPKDLAPLFEAHPELAPAKVGDWGIFWDDTIDLKEDDLTVVKLTSINKSSFYPFVCKSDTAEKFTKIDITKPLKPQIDQCLKQNAK